MDTEKQNADSTGNTEKPADEPKKVKGTPPLSSEEEEERREEVKNIIETLFSRSHLQSDPSLVSVMDRTLHVPIQFLIESKLWGVFGGVSLPFVTSILESSAVVQLDETKTMVRPNFQLTRTTLILRDLPNVSNSQVKDLFEKGEEGNREGGCERKGAPVSITCEMGGFWYVEFENEEDARAALSFIRTQQFHGKRISARMKQDSLLRTSPQPLPTSPLPPFHPQLSPLGLSHPHIHLPHLSPHLSPNLLPYVMPPFGSPPVFSPSHSPQFPAPPLLAFQRPPPSLSSSSPSSLSPVLFSPSSPSSPSPLAPILLPPSPTAEKSASTSLPSPSSSPLSSPSSSPLSPSSSSPSSSSSSLPPSSSLPVFSSSLPSSFSPLSPSPSAPSFPPEPHFVPLVIKDESKQALLEAPPFVPYDLAPCQDVQDKEAKKSESNNYQNRAHKKSNQIRGQPPGGRAERGRGRGGRGVGRGRARGKAGGGGKKRGNGKKENELNLGVADFPPLGGKESINGASPINTDSKASTNTRQTNNTDTMNNTNEQPNEVDGNANVPDNTNIPNSAKEEGHPQQKKGDEKEENEMEEEKGKGKEKKGMVSWASRMK